MPFKFFVAGCQRSGTTMLRLVLDSHPGIHCFDEAIAYDYLSGRSESFVRDQLGKGSIKAIGFKIPRFSEQLTWREQIDPDYGRFKSFYKGEKTLFIVRDVCDVVSSMMSLRAGSYQSWIERYAVQILNSTLPFNPSRHKWEKKMALLLEDRLPVHLVGAFYWEVKNQGLLALKWGGFKVMPVSYEAFVGDPRLHLQSIVRFLGVSWSEDLLLHHRLEHGELDQAGMAIGNTDPRRSIDGKSVGRGELLLSAEQRQDIHAFVGDTCAELLDTGLGSDF